MDKRSFRYIFVLAALMVVAVTADAVSGVSNLSVLTSSTTEFHFVSTQKADLSNIDYLMNDDSSVTAYRSILVGIPAGSNISLRSISPTKPIVVSAATLKFSSGRQTSSSSMISISEPTMIRGRRVVNVRIFPLISDNLFTEVEIHLDFTSARSSFRTTTVSPESDPTFERIFKASVANYEQFVTWEVPAKKLSGALRSGLDDNAAPHPFTLTSSWYKITLNRDGLFQVTGSMLAQAGLNLSGLASSDIRMFYSGGKPLEVENSLPRAELLEIPIIMSDGGDGSFESGDKFYFFGEAMSRWDYQAGQAPKFIDNKYTTENAYWLTVSQVFAGQGLRMTEVDVDPTLVTADTTVNSFTRRVRVEQNNMLSRESSGHDQEYYEWYWTDATNLTIIANTPALISGNPVTVLLKGNTSGNSSTQVGFIDMNVNGSAGANKSCDRTACSYTSNAFIDGGNQIDLNLTLLNPSINVAPYFNYAEVTYQSQISPVNNRFDITLDNKAAIGKIVVEDNFGVEPYLFDLADPRMPARLTGFVRSGGTLEFTTNLEASGPNRFYLQTPVSAFVPISIQSVSINDLRADLSSTDLIIVTTSLFTGALSEYVDYRGGQGHTSKIVLVDDIMKNFGNGLFDPTAIRDYVKFAYENYVSPSPSKVLFVGDANYDMLDNTGSGAPNHVPSYIHGLRQIYSDDSYVYFGSYGLLDADTSYPSGGRGFEMIAARWPVRTAQQVSTIIAKTKLYESSANFGNWRTSVSLVSDDEFASGRINEIFHTQQTEELVKNHLPREFSRNKIYLWDYPFVNRFKPAVNDAIVDAFNQGTLVMNFVGHGNPDVWSHEHVLSRSDDLPRMNNLNRLPLMFAASCQIGFFDDPQSPGMGEDLLTMPNGGAIGVIAASRLVYSGPNADLNRSSYDILMVDKSLSISEAFYTAKLIRQYRGLGFPVEQKNDAAYAFLGDPYVKLGLPQYKVELTQSPDSLIALSTSRVTGRIVDQNGAMVVADGTIQIEIFDSDRDKTHRVLDNSGNLFASLDYKVTGPTLSRGSATISGGLFQFDFVTPLDVSFGDNDARITLYAVVGSADASGLVDSLPISTQIAVSNDSTGPVISLSIRGKSSFVSGDRVRRDDILDITFSDPSGINIAGGIGHGITIEVDADAQNIINIGQGFSYNQDDFTTGLVSFAIDQLTSGERSLKLKGWDNANNSSTLEFVVNVTSSTGAAISDLLNYPNPMSESTTFYFELTQATSLFSLDIFTLSGRKIRSFSRSGLSADIYPNSNYSLVWDGRDYSGDRIATGVYVYKASALPVAGTDAIESFGKIVVINQ